MNRAAPAVIVIAAFVSSVWAEPQVTLFGKLDAGLRHIRYSGNGSVNSVGTFGGSPSVLGIRGREDLGLGGLQASFRIEGTVLTDTGQSGAEAFGLPLWNRSSWMALGSQQAGTLRLGRDWTPSYWGQWQLDPAAHLGLGNHLHLARIDWAMLWRDNAVQYLSPAAEDVTVKLMVSAGEHGPGGDYAGALAEYCPGAVRVLEYYCGTRPYAMASYARTRHAASGDLRMANTGVSIQVGIVDAMFLVTDSRLGALGERRAYASAQVFLMEGHLRVWASMGHVSTNAAAHVVGAPNARQLAAGANYIFRPTVSPTGFYAAISSLENRGNGRLSIEEPGSFTGNASSAGLTLPGGRSSGIEIGMRIWF
jgi:predicted porin